MNKKIIFKEYEKIANISKLCVNYNENKHVTYIVLSCGLIMLNKCKYFIESQGAGIVLYMYT